MSTSPERLFEKLKTLPPQRLSEVEDFVDFLKNRDERAQTAASRRLGEAMARLNALDLPPSSSEEVQTEIEAARRERRNARRADRR